MLFQSDIDFAYDSPSGCENSWAFRLHSCDKSRFMYIFREYVYHHQYIIIQEKKFWRRYIYLWINYALYEELEAEDMERARQVYQACIQVIPHKIFTFAKFWLMYAHFEVRQKNVAAARKILVRLHVFIS